MSIKECVAWLWTSSALYRFGILGRGLIGVVQVALSLCSVWICKCLIDVATGHAEGSLEWLIGVMIACIVLRLLLSVSNDRLGSRLEIRMRNDIRRRLFVRLMESRWMGREKLHTGDVLNRLSEDVLGVTDLLCRNLPAAMVTCVQLAGALFILSRLDPRLAGVTFFIMPVALLLSKSYIRKMRRLSREIRTTDSRVQSHLQEQLQHRTLIRTLEYTPLAIRALAGMQGELRRQVMQRTDFALFSRFMVQMGFAAGYATAFLWGIFGLRDGSVTFGMMTAFLQLVSQIQTPMVDLSRQVPSFVHTLTSVERLSELSSLPAEQQGESIRLEGVWGIRVEGLTFTYPGGTRKVFNHFSHDFAPGSLTAVIGETGAGKSTLVRLILALLRPDEGRVSLYRGMKAVEASPLTRCNLSYVPQGNTLVSGTIRDNLRMGRPSATDDELRAALHTAAADFVHTLPDGLDTLCGEQGAGLSEGQAQRIAIARGLLRPGSILLLDEPTSSLDSATEQLLLERLSQQVQHKTLLLITHRETIARLCTFTVRVEAV